MKTAILVLAAALTAACKKPAPQVEDPKASDGPAAAPAPAQGQVKIDTSMTAGAENIRKAQEAVKQMNSSTQKTGDAATEAAQ